MFAKRPAASLLPKGFAVFVLLLSITCCLQAQAYDLRRYDTQSGLSEGYVYTAVQDDKGFLYLGTGAGVFRFDGAKFTQFQKAQGLAGDFTTASFKDSKGRIWLGHFDGHISILENMKMRGLDDSSSVKSVVCGFAEDARGHIWCASQTGLHLLEPSGVKLSITEGLEGRRTHSMAIGKSAGNEYCLLGTDQGLVVYRPLAGKMQFLYASSQVPATKLQCISKLPSRSGFLIGSEDEGLIEYIPGATDTSSVLTLYNASTGYPSLNNVQCLMIDNQRDIWIGTADQGFLKFKDNGGGTLSPITAASLKDSVGHENLRTIFQDKFGQIWFGTYGNGLFCLSDEIFATYRMRADSTAKSEIRCSMVDRRGDFWVGTSKGIYVLDRRTVVGSGDKYTFSGLLSLGAKQRYGLAEGLPGEDVTCMMQDANQNIWIGTKSSGVAVLETGTEKFKARTFSELSLSNSINRIVQDKAGTIWIASTDGAFSYVPGTEKTNYYGTQNKLPHNNIYDIFCDAAGKLWFATHTNRLSVFDGRSFENIEVTEHGETPNITCIAQTKDGSYWLGTDGSGMYHFDGKHGFTQYTKLDGLTSNYIYQIVVDHFDNVWVTHRDGMSRLIHDTGKIIAYPAKNYFPKQENPINGASIDPQGNIWFASEYGWIKYHWNPNRNKTAAPYIFITSVEVGDSAYDPNIEISLPYGSHSIKIGFLGLTFFNQEDVLYQYQLEGRENDWSAPTKQDFVNFQGLADGHYTFHVRACNAFGKCNESSASFTFTISPPFWKRWWFQLLAALLVVGLVYALFRYRVYRLKKEKEALEEKVRERTLELSAEKAKVDAANIELEKLSLVASETDNAVFILNPQGELTWVNAGFTRLTGLTVEELLVLRNGTQNFLETSSNQQVQDSLKLALEKNISVQYESKLPSKNGEVIWVVSTLTPILDKAGNLRNIVIIDSNITDRKLAEEKIRQLNADLESQVALRTRELAEALSSLQVENAEHIKTAEMLKIINSELDTFVYRASHDLKGPLASLIGLINIAGMELGDNAVATRYLGLMDKASKRLDGILIDLIEATQVKQRQVEITDFKAASLAETVIEVVKQNADMNKAEIIVEIDPELVLHSDETLLTSVLQNFLMNALKYRDKSKETATARLGIHADDAQFQIIVADNGIGIPDEAKHRVFDMFFRGTNQAGGSGLGLYIVKQAVEKLGGTVTLESKVGEGTTMTAKIPRVNP